METWDAVRARRNVREYTDQPISGADLDRILEAGRRAPSSRNVQWWDLVVVTARDQLAELPQVWKGAWHVAGAAAAVAIVVAAEADSKTRMTMEYDLGQQSMSMMLVAADLGIGSAHAAVADQDAARRILGLPEGRVCACLIGFGYPADRPLRPIEHLNRRPFDEVVHRGRW